MTHMESARAGKINDALQAAAAKDGVSPEALLDAAATGRVAILAGDRHEAVSPVAVGAGLRTKVNGTIGTSPDQADLTAEMCKLLAAIRAGADTVMDLSIGGNVREARAQILRECRLPVGTVVIYRAAVDAAQQGRNWEDVSEDEILASIQEQAREGLDFMTIHPAITMGALRMIDGSGRITPIVSRGGALTGKWMMGNDCENPLRSRFDDIIGICRAYNTTISIGDGLRPGCLHDGLDSAHLAEYATMSELVRRARLAGVQVIVEGPGHLRADLIASDVQLLKKVADGAPAYYMGPLVTDVAPGYDHITSAIGATLAASAGADFLCAVTAAEHLSLPQPDDIYLGVMAARIAAHAGDLSKRIPASQDWDDRLSKARYELDWTGQSSHAIDPQKFESLRRATPTRSPSCSICSDFCPMRIFAPARESRKRATVGR